MTPTVDENDFLAEVDPSPAFEAAVMERVARLATLRAAVAAEERHASSSLVLAMVVIGSVAGAVVAALLVPPLLALRVTWQAGLMWVSGLRISPWVPAVLAGGAMWLVWEYVRVLSERRRRTAA